MSLQMRSVCCVAAIFTLCLPSVSQAALELFARNVHGAYVHGHSGKTYTGWLPANMKLGENGELNGEELNAYSATNGVAESPLKIRYTGMGRQAAGVYNWFASATRDAGRGGRSPFNRGGFRAMGRSRGMGMGMGFGGGGGGGARFRNRNGESIEVAEINEPVAVNGTPAQPAGSLLAFEDDMLPEANGEDAPEADAEDDPVIQVESMPEPAAFAVWTVLGLIGIATRRRWRR